MTQIWDIQDQNCLLTVRPKSHKIRGDIQACHYSNISKTLAIATEQMNGLPVKLRSVQKTLPHCSCLLIKLKLILLGEILVVFRPAFCILSLKNKQCVCYICRSIQHADVPITHKEPIHATVYNPSFKQVITCSDGSVS